MTWQADPARYDAERPGAMQYRRAGASGLKLPLLTLGMWHNFGDDVPLDRQRDLLTTAFDRGITHFDLANNYGPPFGASEQNFGRVMASDLHAHRDEILVTTKAGWDMWPGPYGIGGSRKYLIASLDQSLARMGLDYVDIFYHHRPDPETPLEETMAALDHIVQLAERFGGAAKPSGAGGGDCAVALLPDAEARRSFSDACTAAGLPIIAVSAAPGARRQA